MIVNFLKTTQNELHFEIVANNGRTYCFKFDPHGGHTYNENTCPTMVDVSTPKYIKEQAMRVFTRYLNWLLITDTLKSRVVKLLEVKRSSVFSHWDYKIYGNIEPLVAQLNDEIKA